MTKPTKWLCAQRRLIWPSLIRIFAVRVRRAWVLSYPLSAQRRHDQTGLIWVFAGRTAILLVLSWGGSYIVFSKSWTCYMNNWYKMKQEYHYPQQTKTLHLCLWTKQSELWNFSFTIFVLNDWCCCKYHSQSYRINSPISSYIINNLYIYEYMQLVKIFSKYASRRHGHVTMLTHK